MWLVRSPPLKSQEPSEPCTWLPYSACRRVDPCHLREMPVTVLVDREDRIAISHAGVVDPLVFEADINALLAE